MPCPYCSARDTDSRDEVFTRFLGGKAWIPACRQCNSTFGHTIEAAALGHLKNLMFFLRRCGMQPSKPMVWKKVGLGANGETYDIDQDLKATRSSPTIERDAKGRIIRASGSRHHVRQVAKAIKREGREARVVATEPITLDAQRLRITYPLDDNTKRLCVKMSVAVAQRMGASDVLGAPARSYLLDAVALDPCPVRIAIDPYPDLDRQRPLAGHLIYVRASSAERRTYSVVQLFAAIQFYCELAYDYQGADWAIVATHNPVGHEEGFAVSAPVDYPIPPRWLAGTFAEQFGKRLEQLRLELVTLYGDQAPIWFGDAGAGSPTPR